MACFSLAQLVLNRNVEYSKCDIYIVIIIDEYCGELHYDSAFPSYFIRLFL